MTTAATEHCGRCGQDVTADLRWSLHVQAHIREDRAAGQRAEAPALRALPRRPGVERVWR